MKFIRTPTIKLRPYLAPSKPDATFLYAHLSFLILRARTQMEESDVLPIKSVRSVTLCPQCIYICVSLDKQRLLLYTELGDGFFITQMESVYCAVRTGSLNKKELLFVVKGLHMFDQN